MAEEKKEKVKPKKREIRRIVRFSGADLDGSKHLIIALTKVKGVSFSFANALIKIAGLPVDKKAGDLNEKDIESLNKILQKPKENGIPEYLLNRRLELETGENLHLVSSKLSLKEQFDIKGMQKIKSYRGFRHRRNLPVRGQRTKSGYTRPPMRKGRRGTVMGVSKKKSRVTSK